MGAASNALTRSVQASQALLLGDTPPTSPTSPTGSSGPYFNLTDCFSGSVINQPSSAPVTPAPTARSLSGAGGVGGGLGTQSLRGKPRREDWDLFYDKPRHLGGNGQSQQPRSADNDGSVDEAVRGFEEKFARSFKRLLPAGQNRPAAEAGGDHKFVPPPRPPKPPHLSDQPSHNYLNLDQLQSSGRTHSRSSSPRSPPSLSPSLTTPSNADAWYFQCFYSADPTECSSHFNVCLGTIFPDPTRVSSEPATAAKTRTARCPGGTATRTPLPGKWLRRLLLQRPRCLPSTTAPWRHLLRNRRQPLPLPWPQCRPEFTPTWPVLSHWPVQLSCP